MGTMIMYYGYSDGHIIHKSTLYMGGHYTWQNTVFRFQYCQWPHDSVLVRRVRDSLALRPVTLAGDWWGWQWVTLLLWPGEGGATYHVRWARNRAIVSKGRAGTINTWWTLIPTKGILSRLDDLARWLLSVGRKLRITMFPFFICCWKARGWGFCCCHFCSVIVAKPSVPSV